MQGCVPEQDAAFAQSRGRYQDLEGWMASEDTAGLQHSELEEQLDARGRELLQRLFQDRLDLRLPARNAGMTWSARTGSAHARRERPHPAASGRW